MPIIISSLLRFTIFLRGRGKFCVHSTLPRPPLYGNYTEYVLLLLSLLCFTIFLWGRGYVCVHSTLPGPHFKELQWICVVVVMLHNFGLNYNRGRVLKHREMSIFVYTCHICPSHTIFFPTLLQRAFYLFLAEPFTLTISWICQCSILGGLLIIAGLYLVTWASCRQRQAAIGIDHHASRSSDPPISYQLGQLFSAPPSSKQKIID